MASIFGDNQTLSSSNDNQKVGTIESVLSGVASGLIAIPKGFFSLGATLLWILVLDQNRGSKSRGNFLMTSQSLMKKHRQQLLVE
jgi:hypothetical protein